jgi:hypothetical protein
VEQAPAGSWNNKQRRRKKFAQTKGGDNFWKSRQNRFKCGKRGYIAQECPEKEGKQEQMHANVEADAGMEDEDLDQGENIFTQKKKGGVVNKNWLLLNSQSTANQVANPVLVTNIRKAKNSVTIHCNAGSTYSVLEGEFGNVTVKHNLHSIANVLSLYKAKQHHQVTYDSEDREGVFQVHTDEGIVVFKPSARGFNYHNVSDTESNIELMLVNTVRGNFDGYTHQKVKRAREVQRIQGMIANPSEREFAGMVREQLLTDCPVTVRDIDNANQIFGPDLANLRGKASRTKLERI